MSTKVDRVPRRDGATPVEDDRFDGRPAGTGGHQAGLGHDPALGEHRLDGRVQRHLAALTRAAVLDLDLLGEAAADDDDRRHPDELGVLELDARADAPAVVDDARQTVRTELRARSSAATKSGSSLPAATMWTSAGAGAHEAR